MTNIEHLAMRGDPLPDGLQSEDQLLYLQLRNLYQSFRNGTISKETGSADKSRIMAEYRKRKSMEAFHRKQSRHTVQMWHDMEHIVSDYRKCRTLENADRMVDTIEGKVLVLNENN